MFSLYRNQNGENFEKYVSLPTTASETYTIGEALVLSSGKVTKCGATAVPTHIAGCSYAAPASGMQPIPCIPIQKSFELITTAYADPSALNIGDKVTLHTDGLQVTATTTSGVAEIVNKLGAAAAGAQLVVKF